MKKFFFLLFIVFLPSQIGIHFWPNFAFVNGIRVDYFSPTLYITDVLILSMLVFEVFNQFSNFKFSRPRLARGGQISNWRGNAALLCGFLFVGFIYLNSTTSLSPVVSIYKWIKVLEFGLLGLIVVRNKKPFAQQLNYLYVPVLYESVLAVWQFFAQSSIGGLWYFLGERTFNSSTPGIANAYFNGQLLMRSYGTFSHPNVLGGFLAVFLPLVLARFLHNFRKINASKKLFETGGWVLVIILGYVALFLSLSRTAVFVGTVASFVVTLPYLSKFFNLKLSILNRVSNYRFLKFSFALILITIVFYAFVPRLASLLTESEPIVIREQLNNLAIKQFAKSPILGTGLGTSLLYASWQSPITDSPSRIKNFSLQFQPTHNLYLLALAETGTVGFVSLMVAVILGITRQYRHKNWIFLTSLLSICFLGLFDHYFLTLQQGQLILVLVLGLCLSGSGSYSRV